MFGLVLATSRVFVAIPGSQFLSARRLRRLTRINPSVACGKGGECGIVNAELRMGRVVPSPVNLAIDEVRKQR
jgi:hypothetical protein